MAQQIMGRGTDAYDLTQATNNSTTIEPLRGIFRTRLNNTVNNNNRQTYHAIRKRQESHS